MNQHPGQQDLFADIVPDRSMDGAHDPAPDMLGSDSHTGRVFKHLMGGGSISRLNCEELGILNNSSIHSYVSPIRTKAFVPVNKGRRDRITTYRISLVAREAFRDPAKRPDQLAHQRYEVFRDRYMRPLRQLLRVAKTAAEFPDLARQDPLFSLHLQQGLRDIQTLILQTNKQGGSNV